MLVFRKVCVCSKWMIPCANERIDSYEQWTQHIAVNHGNGRGFTWREIETYSKPCQTSKMGFFAKIVNGFLFSQKSSVLDVCQGSEYVSAEKWPDKFDVRYIHRFQPEPTHKIRKHRQKDPDNFDFCCDCGYHPNQHVDDKKMKCRMPFWDKRKICKLRP